MNFSLAAKKGPIYKKYGVISYTFLIINEDNCEFGLLFFVPGDKLKFDNNIFTLTEKDVARGIIGGRTIDDRDGNYYYFGEVVFGSDNEQIKYLIVKRITFAENEIEKQARRHIAAEARPARDSKPDSYGFKSRRRSRKRVSDSVKRKFLFYLKKFNCPHEHKRVTKSVNKSRKRVTKSVKKSRKRVTKSVKKSRK